MMPQNSDSLDSKHVCFKCIDETYLKQKIRSTYTKNPCSYCSKERKSIPIEDLADIVEQAFGDHYMRTASSPDGWESAMLSDKEFDFEWHREGEETALAIAEEICADEVIAQDIQLILENKH